MRRMEVLQGHLGEARVLSASSGAAAEPELVVSSPAAGLAVFALNRPSKLNALTMGMIHLMRDAVEVIAAPGKKIRCLVVKGNGRGFCAGGDVAAARASFLAGGRLAHDFFFEEYALIHRLAELPRTAGIVQVTLWDGISMGGGVGLGVHAPVRVVTETTTWAKPETRIGLFPDVGGTHALPRVRGGLPFGLYIALTGVRLSAVDLMWSGLATHFVPSAKLRNEKELHHCLRYATEGSGSVEDTLSRIDAQLLALRGDAAPDESKAVLKKHAAAIVRCFSADTVDEIVSRLESEIDDREWAQKTLKTLKDMSPTSVKVTFEACHRNGRPEVSLADALSLEYRIVQGCALRPQPLSDFHEGVRAVLVDKDTPKYNPARLRDVDPATVQSYFQPIPAGHLRGELRLPWP